MKALQPTEKTVTGVDDKFEGSREGSLFSTTYQLVKT